MNARDIFGTWTDNKTGTIYTIAGRGIEFYAVIPEGRTHGVTLTKGQVVSLIAANGWVKKGA